MNLKKGIFLTLTILLLFNLQLSFAQDCLGPLSILLSGSNSANPLMVEVEATGITCASDANGNITLSSSGGNPSYSYSWADLMTNDSIREDLPEGTYYVTVTDMEGCSEILSWNISELTPENSGLAMEDGCGICLLGDGESSYFFNEQTRYIASLADENADAQELGDTEVCLYIDNTVQTCNDAPYLQRQWSVSPNNQQYTCMKLFFTEAELANLAIAVPNETVTAQELLDDQRICLSALNGGAEDCTDYISATIFSTADAPPLVLTEENAAQGIWSVNVCTDEFATYYLHVCDIPLPVELLYFSGQRKGKNNLLTWETATESNTIYFELLKRNKEGTFSFLDQVNAIGTSTTNQRYNYIDNNPSEVDYYQLKIVDKDGSFDFSNIVVIKEANALVSQIFPTLFEDRVFYETVLSAPDQLEFLVFDALGRRAFRQRFLLERGSHRLTLKLDHLASGNYFVEVVSEKREMESFKLVKW